MQKSTAFTTIFRVKSVTFTTILPVKKCHFHYMQKNNKGSNEQFSTTEKYYTVNISITLINNDY
jgi:hypothetical protein